MGLKATLKRRMAKRAGIAVLALLAITIGLAVGVTVLDDPVSTALRARIEASLNAEIDRLYQRLRENRLTRLDTGLLHAATLAGVGVGYVAYPEASAILFHYVYGDGSELELSSDYFRQSPYLTTKIASLGQGQHGPIAFKQSCDWRLSLALNPYYLEIDGDRVRISHTKIEFAPRQGPPVRTVVPIGKLRLHVYDNLVSALSPTPFAAYAEWKFPDNDKE